MRSILLTRDGDLDLTSGGLRLVDSVEQRVRTRLRWFRGEWFLDRLGGVAYFERVLVATPNHAHIRAEFRRVIVETPGVRRLTALLFDFDAVSRELSVRAMINNRPLVEVLQL